MWIQKARDVDESDEDDIAEAKPHVEEVVEEEEEEEIVESDVELEGDIVEPDNDPPQKVYFIFYFCGIYMFISSKY